jgi:hypothetical protein
MQLNSTITILLARFNGQVLIPFAAAAECVGIPEQTARNKLVKGVFPIPTVLSGGRRFVHVQDLANYVESLREFPGKKTNRGPKTKASKMPQLTA